MIKTLEPRVRSNFCRAEGQVQLLLLDDGGEGQVQLLLLDDGGVHLTAWPEQKEESMTLSLIFFWKTQVHLWWWRNGQQLEEVGRRTPMRRCEEEERISITELCCVWHSFYTLKKEKWPFMNLAAEDEKRIWTLRLLWQASSCWPLNLADEDEKRFWTQYLIDQPWSIFQSIKTKRK